jgi:choice-of-anchor C domain-containing protein
MHRPFARHVLAGALLAATMCLTASIGSAQTSNLIGDSSFDDPEAPAGSFITFGDGPFLGPWVVSKDSVDVLGRGFWQASSATDEGQSVDLSGNDAGAITQTVATTPGAVYTLRFALAGNVDSPLCGGSPLVKTLRVLFDGAVVGTFGFDVRGHSPTSMGWLTKSISVRAPGSQSTLEFESLTPGCSGPVIDAVVLTLGGTQPPNAVPPSAYSALPVSSRAITSL